MIESATKGKALHCGTEFEELALHSTKEGFVLATGRDKIHEWQFCRRKMVLGSGDNGRHFISWHCIREDNRGPLDREDFAMVGVKRLQERRSQKYMDLFCHRGILTRACRADWWPMAYY